MTAVIHIYCLSRVIRVLDSWDERRLCAELQKVYCWPNTIIREKTSHDFKTVNMWLLLPSAPPVLVALGRSSHIQEAVSMHTVYLLNSTIKKI